MHIIQLMASPFVGGPERQVLGLAAALRGTVSEGTSPVRTTFLSFAERGLARPFLDQARADGFEAIELTTNYPHIARMVGEVAGLLDRLGGNVLCCNGYKPDVIGWRAARRAGIPVVAIAHGWTGVTLRVRLWETLDALVMRWMDATVCVSEAMATRVRRCGVRAEKTVVIRNALDATRYDHPDPDCRDRVLAFFPCDAPALLVGAVGRLSPEKGFDVLISAASVVCQKRRDVGFVIFGEGPMRPFLEQQIRQCGLVGRVVLAGFRSDLERLLPGLDLAVSSSHTEGLPVAVLEAQAAGLPVVATTVGGTAEVVLDGVTGSLVPPADPGTLAEKILHSLANEGQRQEMGRAAWQRVRDEFTFAGVAAHYLELFHHLLRQRKGCHAPV